MVEVQGSYSSSLLRGGKGLIAWQRLARFRLAAAQVVAHRSRPEVNVLVDIGAADGIGMRFWKAIAEKVVSLNRYQNESRQFRAAHPDRPVVTCDVSRLPIADDCADAIVSLEALHYIAGHQARTDAFCNIRRALREDGVFVCSLPVEIGLPAVVKYIGRKFAGIELRGMTFGLMLKLCFHRWCDLSKHYQGSLLGFDITEFVKHMQTEFDIVRRIHVPLPYPFNTNCLYVCKAKPAQFASSDSRRGRFASAVRETSARS